ncbi:fimbrillin family protein, partial [Bacteroides xylanisolvens]
MKIYNKYIVLAAMALTFAACTQEDDFTPQTDNDAVKINATIGKFQTRVAYEDDGATNFINGDEICVQNTLRDTKNIATYTFDGTTWTTTDAFVWNGSAKNQFKAWYPAATASFDSFDLPTDQSAGIDKADWMTAETEEMTKPGSGVLDLNFVHKLTKVTVTVSFNSQYPAGDNYVSMFRFFTNEETPVEVTPYESRDGYTAILLPGVYAEEASFITLEMNFEDNLTVPVNSTLIAGLEAGKHYNFHLTVGKDAVGISYVRVLDWDEKEIDGGMAEEVPPTYIYDATTNTYKVYQGDYLQTAIDEAEVTGTAENPATVKIMADMEITGVPDKYGHVDQNILVDAGVIILDLNGHLVKGMTDRHGINITDYATLTIDDSSESKQGKFMCKDHVLYMDEHAKLIINNGTFENWAESYDELEGVVLRGLGWDWSAIINGGTFVSVNYVIMMSATVEINGGTFIGENYALDISNGSNEPININGGSFVGGNYDLFIYSEDGAVPAFLSANAETGVGATFPGGLTIDYDEPKTLNDIIMDGVGYFDAEGNQITEGLDGTNIAGDVTVKRIH